MASNHLNIVDLFAGAGGFGLGFSLAGHNIICSLEKDQWACDTLRANTMDPKHIIQGDISEFSTKKKIFSYLKDKPDIIIGGPPCQGFSLAGPIKDPSDPRNSLFKHFVAWVQFVEPSFFVMENVKGLLYRQNSKGKKVIDVIRKAFKDTGYDTDIWVLNAAEFGVPQNRERIFIVGNNRKLKLSAPKATHILLKDLRDSDNSGLKQSITVKEAILDLPVLYARQGEEEQPYSNTPFTDYQRWSRKDQDILFNHVAMNHTSRLIERYKYIQQNGSFENMPEEYQVRMRNGNGIISSTVYQSNYRHLQEDMVSYTIPASFYSNFIHPLQPRNITSREAARLQSFPDNYRFAGKRTLVSSKLLRKNGVPTDFLSQYNQIGNAVPPLLAKAIADHIASFQ